MRYMYMYPEKERKGEREGYCEIYRDINRDLETIVFIIRC